MPTVISNAYEYLNTLRPRQNGRHFADDIFIPSLEWKCMNFALNFIEICSYGSNQQYSIIGSDNGFAPTGQQAVIWTNDGKLLTHICVTWPQWVKSLMISFWPNFSENDMCVCKRDLIFSTYRYPIGYTFVFSCETYGYTHKCIYNITTVAIVSQEGT